MTSLSELKIEPIQHLGTNNIQKFLLTHRTSSIISINFSQEFWCAAFKTKQGVSLYFTLSDFIGF